MAKNHGCRGGKRTRKFAFRLVNDLTFIIYHAPFEQIFPSNNAPCFWISGSQSLQSFSAKEDTLMVTLHYTFCQDLPCMLLKWQVT